MHICIVLYKSANLYHDIRDGNENEKITRKPCFAFFISFGGNVRDTELSEKYSLELYLRLGH